MERYVRKREGRPGKGEPAGRTKALSVRVTPSIRSRLEKAAVKARHSLSDEVELRLQYSLDDDEEYERRFRTFGGRQNFAACEMFGEVMARMSAITGKSWADDAWTADQVAKGIVRLLRAWHPGGDVAPYRSSVFPGVPVEGLGEAVAEHLLVRLVFKNLNVPDGTPDPDEARKQMLGDLGTRDSERQQPDPDDIDANQGTVGLRRLRTAKKGTSK